MTKRILLRALLLLLCLPAQAAAPPDTAYQQLHKRYLQLYNEPDQDTAFYETSEKLKAYYLEHDNKESYYKCRINEALYDAERGFNYRAIKKAHTTLEDMQRDGIEQYQVVYTVLGSIFDSRGNYRMAEKYYKEALKNAAPRDTGSLISIYSRLADLKSTREPKEAWQWNERFGQMVQQNPEFLKVYLILKGQISFFLADRRKFDGAYRELEALRQQHPDLNEYDMQAMSLMQAVLHGDHDTALGIMRSDTVHRDDLNNYDIRVKAYQIMGMERLAMAEVEKRRDLRDSLNSDMLFNNINEINAELGVFRLNQEAAREREVWLAAVIALLAIGIVLVVSRYLVRRNYQRRLQKKNEELLVALDRAQESDRMKTLFIQQVSHEIRTPLNIITGFTQVITNGDFKLSDGERDMMLKDISRNTSEITYLVNELLEVAQDESKEYYEKNDDVDVEQLCQDIMAFARRNNSQELQLRLINQLDRGYTMRTNRSALEKILTQLMMNAMKFTKQGSVELKVRERAAHGGVEFTVTDTGIGIAEELHDKVFERFYKVDHFQQGIGLGLTLSRKVTELLGGTLNIDAHYKKGARFVLTFPTLPA